MEVASDAEISPKAERLKNVGKQILESITFQFLQVRIDKPADYPKFNARENSQEVDTPKDQEA